MADRNGLTATCHTANQRNDGSSRAAVPRGAGRWLGQGGLQAWQAAVPDGYRQFDDDLSESVYNPSLLANTAARENGRITMSFNWIKCSVIANRPGPPLLHLNLPYLPLSQSQSLIVSP